MSSAPSFAELGLAPELLRAVTEAGNTTPTPIQQQAIPVVLAGRDVMGGAQTGTGKTAGFVLPLLQRLARHASTSPSPRRGRPPFPCRDSHAAVDAMGAANPEASEGPNT